MSYLFPFHRHTDFLCIQPTGMLLETAFLPFTVNVCPGLVILITQKIKAVSEQNSVRIAVSHLKRT